MAKTKEAAADAGVEFEGGVSEGEGGGIIVDLSKVDDWGEFPVLPRGQYNCHIDELTYDLSQNSGQPMWSVQLLVDAGNYDEEYVGQRLFTHISFSPKALPRSKRTIQRIAPELLEGPFDAEQVASEGTLLDRNCIARVDIRKYEGQDRNNVRDLLPASEDAGGFGA